MDNEVDTDPPARKRKRKKRGAAPEHVVSREPNVQSGWTTGQVLMTLAIGLGVGAFAGYQLRGGARATSAPEATQAPPSMASPEPLGPVVEADARAGDKFGRAPGDQHFGHDHPPEGAQPPSGQTPPPSGPDSFGRAPGSEHYGHSHQ